LIDPKHGGRTCSTYTDYVSIPMVEEVLYGGKCLHTSYGTAYCNNIRANIKHRAAAFLKPKEYPVYHAQQSTFGIL